MSQKRICPKCKRGPRYLTYRHPETKEVICQNCYQKATGKRSSIKEGICPVCGKGPRCIPYCHPQTKENICHGCFSRIKRREKRAANPRPIRIKKPATRKRRENNSYPTTESVIIALDARRKEGKQNYASILNVQDTILYRRALYFSIPLPKMPKKEKKIRKSAVVLRKTKRLKEIKRITRLPEAINIIPGPNYKLGQVVRGNNSEDKEVFGIIGRVMAVSKGTLRIDFGQWGGTYREYKLEAGPPPIVLYEFLSKTSV